MGVRERGERRPRARRRGGALVRVAGGAVGGAAVMAVALGTGVACGEPLARALGASGWAARLVAAGTVSAVALALVALVLRRQGRSWAALGFGAAGPSLRAFATGVGVTGGCAALVLGAGTAAGWLRWSRPDVPALLAYAVLNGVVGLLLEALPEETTLRGLTWTALRERFSAAATAFGTTLLFLGVPGAASAVAAVLRPLTGGTPEPVRFAPAGQGVGEYLFLLSVFGLMLVAARTALGRAPLWTAVGAHLTFLTVNRVTFEGDVRGAGWFAVPATPDVVLLVPAYLALTTGVFLVIRRAAARKEANPGRVPRTGPVHEAQGCR
ncbi:CPBP family glutamic-type intramembrane protease [Streptomyces huiliensis]|uniref:CPBP family glutamic-type intramembrane protease n=1 Tax=Streptomyces huiliensis TaxID=2876027 RepID=UPI001CC18387|nr:CPBP family glutamic-type intramembrane protease [Streptomyces huiliensis]MBZ4321043.1 hypothetical protein [Streptomyces huiliensis]